MKVLHVIPSVAARYGGPSQAVFAMCRGLQESGAEVLVATTDADGQGRLGVKLGSLILYQGVPTIFFKRQWSEAFKYSHPLAAWLEANVKNFQAVHIHAVFSHSCLAAARACLRHGVPYVVRPLGTLDPWSLKQKPLRKQLFWHLGVKRMLHEAKAIHYTAEEEMRLAEESLELTNGKVVPLGLELETLQSQMEMQSCKAEQVVADGYPYILVLARLHPKKNLELLIDAFLTLTRRKELSHWRLVLAGEGTAEYTASLKRMTINEGRGQQVIFSGWLEGRQKVCALQNASLLALPSHQENFGLCVAEAMVCGVPVLVSPHVNLAPDIRKACAGWVAPLDKAAFTDVLAEAITSDEERRRRGSAGREYARRYTTSAVAAGLMNMYTSVTNAV